jgi:hypothetical protein
MGAFIPWQGSSPGGPEYQEDALIVGAEDYPHLALGCLVMLTALMGPAEKGNTRMNLVSRKESKELVCVTLVLLKTETY